MASNPPDQNVLLKEVLDALKDLQLEQTLLASNVDAISGRVNVLAGMKEVRDVAAASSASASSTSAASSSSTPVKKIEPISSVDESQPDDVVPQSPSLPATGFEVDASAQVSRARRPSVTSRIIL